MRKQKFILLVTISVFILASCAVSKSYMQKQTGFSLNLSSSDFEIRDIKKKASTIEWMAISASNRCYSCVGDDMVQEVECLEVDCDSNNRMVSKQERDGSRRSVPRKAIQAVGYKPLSAKTLHVSEPEWAGNIVYVDRVNNVGIPLEFKRAIVQNKQSGMSHVRTVVTIEGPVSTVRVLSNQGRQFIYRGESNTRDPKRVIHLFRLETEKNKRIKILASASVYGESTIDPQNSLPYKVERYGEDSYLITLPDMEPSEYAFQLGGLETNEVHLFGIDYAESLNEPISENNNQTSSTQSGSNNSGMYDSQKLAEKEKSLEEESNALTARKQSLDKKEADLESERKKMLIMFNLERREIANERKEVEKMKNDMEQKLQQASMQNEAIVQETKILESINNQPEREIQFAALSNPSKSFYELKKYGQIVTEKVPGKRLYRYKVVGRFQNPQRTVNEIRSLGFNGAFLVKN